MKKLKLYPRALGYKGGVKNPGVAAAQKANWANPEYRKRMTESRRLWGRVRKAKNQELHRAAEESAKETMAQIKKSGTLDLDAAGELAMLATIEVLRKPGDKRTKLAAARQVLEWTRSKPAAKTDVTVNAAEEWLKAVATQNDGPAEDA